MQGLDIIIFAAIAVFFILKLIGVIGQREEGEEARRKKGNIIDFHQRYQQAKKQQRSQQAQSEENDDSGVIIELSPKSAMGKDEASKKSFLQILETMAIKPTSKLGKQLKKIHAQNKTFHPQEFLASAETAFEMILDAYAKGEMTLLKNLVTKDIYKLFEQSVNQRKKDGHRLQLVILAMKEVSIHAGNIESDNIAITVKFINEQNSVTYNKDNKIISGDSKNNEIVTDIWTFTKPVNANNPNWYLAATGSDD